MQHHLDRIALRVLLVPLAPVVTNGVSKDATILVKLRRCNAASNVGVSLKTVLGILVPEVECAIRTRCAEGAVNGVEGNVVDGVDIDDVVDGGIAVAFERKVRTVLNVSGSRCSCFDSDKKQWGSAYLESLSSTY